MADTIFAGWQRRPSDAYIYTGHATETTSKEEQFAAPLHVSLHLRGNYVI